MGKEVLRESFWNPAGALQGHGCSGLGTSSPAPSSRWARCRVGVGDHGGPACSPVHCCQLQGSHESWLGAPLKLSLLRCLAGQLLRMISFTT